MPVRLGSPLRTPHYAWPRWGISFQRQIEREALIAASEQCYRSEWDQTTQTGHEEIAAAAKEAGLGDANARLNAAIGAAVAALAKPAGKTGLRILDLGAGAGATSLAVLEALRRAPRPIDLTLVDPAMKALDNAACALAGFRLVQQLEFKAVPETDRQFLSHAAPASFDLIVSVAAIHHHADILPILAGCFRCLRPGGILVLGDWHNSMWEHPRRVLDLLERMVWPSKADAVRRFCNTFPMASRKAPALKKTADRKANDQIIAFWLAYGRLHRSGTVPFLILEGHRPATRYLQDLRLAGFTVPTCIRSWPNPRFLLPRSSLLAVIVTVKPGDNKPTPLG
jgi:SAM-dependent methyltransferase